MSVPWRHVSLAACLEQLSLSLFMWSTAHRGPWDTWQHWSSPLRKAEPGAVGHVTAPELPSQGGRARSHGTRGSVGAHLGKEARLEEGRGTRDSTGAHLDKEVRAEAAGHVAAPELASPRRQGPGPQDTWWL
jgi:hypothetical protein